MPGFITIGVPAAFAASAVQPGFPKGPLEAITDAYGRLMETLIGRPTTKIYSDFSIGDSSLFVETTLAYPDSGAVWAGKYLVEYASKTAGSFEGCTSRVRSKTLAAGTMVTLHLPSAPPG